MMTIAHTQRARPEHTGFLLASMRLAIANLRTWERELEFIGVALDDGLIDVETACDELDAIGLLRWLPAGNKIDRTVGGGA
jgi:hypothetical protein